MFHKNFVTKVQVNFRDKKKRKLTKWRFDWAVSGKQNICEN